jgi:SLT domain-containing protein
MFSYISFSSHFVFIQYDDHTQYTHSHYQQFDEHNNTEQEIAFRSKNSALVHYQNPNRHSNNTASAAVQYFDSLPTIDIIDPMQAQFMYQTSSTNSSDIQNQLNKFRILCNVKDRKITELENRCAEYVEKYNSDVRVFKHKIELSESKKKLNLGKM